jgi:hypothetical protein
MMTVRQHDYIFNRIKLVPRPTDRDVRGPCWRWQGHCDIQGYPKGTPGLIHRFLYQEFVGEIPAGLEMDHLCRVRDCCNPKHVEPVTHLENIRRGEGNSQSRQTHCWRGHPLSGENLYLYKGARHCRTCRREEAARLRAANLEFFRKRDRETKKRRYWERKREAQLPGASG